ncbi:MAG: hypothetical protein Q7R72_01810 [bacterium]|nr:hypothetical protein [bacterium]
MKKTITIIVILVALGAIAYGVYGVSPKNNVEKVATDPCGVDLRAAFLNDAPFSMTETEVATTILTQYLEALKKLTACPTIGITNYNITYVGNIREVKGDFMADVKFDFKPISITENTLISAEARVDGEWIRDKQAGLGIIRASGTGTTTVSYRLAI